MSDKNLDVGDQPPPTTYLRNGYVFVPLPGDVDEEEMRLLEELKNKVYDALRPKNYPEPYTKPQAYEILRFLRARNYDVTAAFDMIMAALHWKAENRPDLITDEDIESELAKGKAYFRDYDLEGRLIGWIFVKRHKASNSDEKKMQQLCLYWIEKTFRMTQSHVPYVTIVFDMAEFGMANMDYGFVKYMIHVLANYYPDTLGFAAIVNAPWLFRGCWALIRPWLDPVTASKIAFINRSDLPKYVSKTVIPEVLGGDSSFDWAETYIPVSERLISISETSSTSLPTSSSSSSVDSASSATKSSDHRSGTNACTRNSNGDD